jgi:hypothetical protein
MRRVARLVSSRRSRHAVGRRSRKSRRPGRSLIALRPGGSGSGRRPRSGVRRAPQRRPARPPNGRSRRHQVRRIGPDCPSHV